MNIFQFSRNSADHVRVCIKECKWVHVRWFAWKINCATFEIPKTQEYCWIVALGPVEEAFFREIWNMSRWKLFYHSRARHEVRERLKSSTPRQDVQWKIIRFRFLFNSDPRSMGVNVRASRSQCPKCLRLDHCSLPSIQHNFKSADHDASTLSAHNLPARRKEDPPYYFLYTRDA